MNITLLTPTKNRSQFLDRLLSYYRSVAFDGYICVGDSSEGEELALTKKIIQNHQNDLRIIYGEYPGISNSWCIAKMLDVVPTDYAALLPDDDFLVPDSLGRCAAFLETNPDYVAAHGIGVMINVVDDQVYGPVSNVGPYKLRALEHESGAMRIRDHLGDYSVTLFSVHRVETWRKMYEHVPSIADAAFADELITTSCAVAMGKVKELEGLYLVRHVHSGHYQHLDVYDWVTNPQWQKSYEVFRDSVAEELVRKDGIDVEHARGAVKDGFWAYLSNSLHRRWAREYQQNRPGLRSRARAAARSWSSLRSGWRQARSFLPGSDHKLSQAALMRRSSPYHKDFMQVYRTVTGISGVSPIRPTHNPDGAKH